MIKDQDLVELMELTTDDYATTNASCVELKICDTFLNDLPKLHKRERIDSDDITIQSRPLVDFPSMMFKTEIDSFLPANFNNQPKSQPLDELEDEGLQNVEVK